MLSRSLGMPSCKNGPPSIWDTHGLSGNVFANSTASSLSPYPRELNPWISNVTEDASSHVTSERQTPDTTLDPRCQSGPSARNSFDPKEWRFSKDYGADQQRLQISDPHFDNFPTPATFTCWKIRFKTEVCTCSQFPTKAVLWIQEVEMVESVDDLMSSRSIRGTPGPDFELLDARIASALNKIVQNTHIKKKVSLEEMKAHKEDRFLQRRQIAHLIYEYFQVTGANDSVENYADLFTIVLRNDDIQEFDSKWDGILLSMTKSHLMTSWKDCTNWEYESLRNSRPYWNCTTWRFIRRKLDLIITDWRQWWKEVSSRIYEWRILRPEMEILKQAPWSRIKG